MKRIYEKRGGERIMIGGDEAGERDGWRKRGHLKK